MSAAGEFTPGTSVGAELPKLMARIRDEFIPAYQSIGPAGGFAIACMRADLDRATVALAEGDVLAILRSYQALSAYKL